jgi:thiamine transport system ATP-binding protein
VLTLDDITVRYGDTVAVDGVDLTVEKGSTVCVLGPSGCGKSTLLRVVTGLVRPDAGRVCWDSEDITGVPTHRRGFGLMFQDHALFPHRDVAANVGFGLRMQGRSRGDIAARVDELLELVGLAGYGRRAVDELSGGEQQRVALARALAPEPRMLLLDEPLGSLDRVLRDRLLDELPSLFDRLGTTVLYVTHDQDEARAIADRVAVMRAGRIAQVGTPAEVWEHPADEFVAEFVRPRRS